MPADDQFAEEFQELAKDRFIVGSPEDCIGELKRYEELGIDQVSLRMNWPGMPLSDAIKGIEDFAADVMPSLR